MRYSAIKKGYKLFNPHSREFLFSRDVVFYESIILFKHLKINHGYLFPNLDIVDDAPLDLSFFSLSSFSVVHNDDLLSIHVTDILTE